MYTIRYWTAFGILLPVFSTGLAAICFLPQVGATGEGVIWLITTVVLLMVFNPAKILGFIPKVARWVIAGLITALTAVFTLPVSAPTKAAVIAVSVLIALFLKSAIPKLRDKERFLKCREVSDALATVSAPESSRAMDCWENKGRRALREFFLLAQQKDVNEDVLSSVAKWAFAVGWVFADKDHAKMSEQCRTLTDEREGWKQKYLTACAEKGNLENRIALDAHEYGQEEKKSDLLRADIRTLRERVTELETASEQDALTIDELTAELDRLRTAQAEADVEDTPEIPPDKPSRDEWIFSQHEQGASLSEIAKMTGLSKSMIQKIVKEIGMTGIHGQRMPVTEKEEHGLWIEERNPQDYYTTSA